jgi:hypothetical protein
MGKETVRDQKCPYCGKMFHKLGIHNHKESCRELKKGDGGEFITNKGPMKAAEGRRGQAKSDHGYGDLKEVTDYVAELNYVLEKAGLKNPNEKVDKLGFSDEFYEFSACFGLGQPRDYQHSIGTSISNRINDMRGDTAQPFYSPTDDMYGNATGQDYWHDSGRVPVSHLMALTSKRIGCAHRACNGAAKDTFDNRFDFVKYSDLDTPIKNNKSLDTLLGWMRRSQFVRKVTEVLDFNLRSGLGHLNIEKYMDESLNAENWAKTAPKTKPERFVSFSAYYMTPQNINQPNRLDYKKNDWNYIGGLQGAHQINHSRIYVMEMEREELALRGLSLPELCWVACMCYLNVQYYILKSLAQLGNVTIGVTVDSLYPTPTEVARYLSLLNTMKANNFYVLGRGAELKIENAAAKLGSGIKDFMEFLKEDMSSAWIFPKNQLFGRSDGGGLNGAGAVVTKEDYLGSNISTKQLYLAEELMIILIEYCHFTGLDDMTIKFNIDLLKTKEQILGEQMMEEDLEKSKIMTEQTKLAAQLYKQQAKLQMEMAKVQLEMFKKDPEGFMQESQEDEENLEKKEQKQDFIRRKQEHDYLKARFAMMKTHYDANDKLIKDLSTEMQDLHKIRDQDNFAWKKMIKAE